MFNRKEKPLSFIVKYSDEYGTMNYNYSKEYLSRMEGEWRLPKVSECELIKDLNIVGDGFIESNLCSQKDDFYLTDDTEPSLDIPICYSFEHGKSFLTTYTTNHKVRLIRNAYKGTSKLKTQELVDMIVETFSNYVENIDLGKCKLFFTNYFRLHCNDEANCCFRYLVMEDYNMSNEYNEFDFSYFNFSEDMDLIFAWENCFSNDYDLYSSDLSEENSIRDNFIGIIDLKLGKYYRVNGYGDYYEYDEFPPINRLGELEVTPKWDAWLK